ncbi:MAG: T9SS type A sorting domain-containing protein [Candidatus Krumholzibacteria bacterium]|nr:T9SS type A sorting domain-containing protein [Candidatus Krumholzibacteria bacterium]
MNTYLCLKTSLPFHRHVDTLGFIRPVGTLILTIALFVTPVSADTIVLTLDEHTIPDTLQCGETWTEAGLDLAVDSVECGGFPGGCDITSRPDHLHLFPGFLNVDLTDIAGAVVSATVIVGSVCDICSKVVFYDGTTVVDSAIGGLPLTGDTLEVFTSGMPVDRLALEACYHSDVYDIRIEFDPTPTGVRPTKYARGAPLESWPNPFNATTQISFNLETGGRVQLLIYDVKGRMVRSLVDTELVAAPWSAAWDGRDASGRRLATGVYFARLAVNGRITASRKVVIAR